MASLSTLELLPNLALACLPPALKSEGEAWVQDLQRLVQDPTSNPAEMSLLVARLPSLLQHLSKPFLAFSASVIVADLKQYLPSPSSSEGPGPAENGAVENGVVKKEPTEAATSKEESEERNRKALEKIVAAVLDLMLAHQTLLSRPPPAPSPATQPDPESTVVASGSKRSASDGRGGKASKRARREQAEKERLKGILELGDDEIDRLAKVPEPDRYKEWLQRTFVSSPTANVSQGAFWTSYTSTFRPALERLGSGMPALLSPGEAIKNVNIVYEAAAPKMAGEGESRVFVIQGIEFRPFPPPREPTPEGESDDENEGGASNRAVLDRLAEVEGKLDRVLAALASR